MHSNLSNQLLAPDPLLMSPISIQGPARQGSIQDFQEDFNFNDDYGDMPDFAIPAEQPMDEVPDVEFLTLSFDEPQPDNFLDEHTMGSQEHDTIEFQTMTSPFHGLSSPLPTSKDIEEPESKKRKRKESNLIDEKVHFLLLYADFPY
jgi:hypothetical protein